MFFFFLFFLLSTSFKYLVGSTLALFHFIIDKKELDVEMSHLVAASVEVKGDVAEEGT